MNGKCIEQLAPPLTTKKWRRRTPPEEADAAKSRASIQEQTFEGARGSSSTVCNHHHHRARCNDWGNFAKGESVHSAPKTSWFYLARLVGDRRKLMISGCNSFVFYFGWIELQQQQKMEATVKCTCESLQHWVIARHFWEVEWPWRWNLQRIRRLLLVCLLPSSPEEQQLVRCERAAVEGGTSYRFFVLLFSRQTTAEFYTAGEG